MPKIAISGSHSTGKSTLINALKEIPSITNRFVFKGEILRDIKKAGIDINEYGSDDTQRIVMARFLEYSIIPNCIIDRCAMDGLVYTTYLYERNQVSKKTLRIAEAIFQNVRYDMHFYIAPEFDIVPDGIRSENVEFRDRIAEIFEEYFQSYNIEPLRLTGDVENRVNQFTSALEAYDKWIEDEKNAYQSAWQSSIDAISGSEDKV